MAGRTRGRSAGRCARAARSGRAPARPRARPSRTPGRRTPAPCRAPASTTGRARRAARGGASCAGAGAAYIMRLMAVACSANSLTRDVCCHTSCESATSVPSASAPRRMRWIVGARWPAEREHLLAREGELHRPAGHGPRGHDRQHRRRVDDALGAEAAADERRRHVDLLGLEPEQAGDRVAHAVDALRRLVEAQRAVLPAGHGRVRLHRVVVLDRRAVGRLDRRGRRAQRGLDVAAWRRPPTPSGATARGRRRASRTRCSAASCSMRTRPDRVRADLEALGDDRADDLAAEVHLGGLQDRELGVARVGEPRRVLVGEHGEHARQRRRRAGVDRGHAPAGDGRQQREDVGGVGRADARRRRAPCR